MMFAKNADDFISEIDEEEDNVHLNLKLNNWLDSYFAEGSPNLDRIPSIYKQFYYNIALSLAFLYKFIQNSDL